MNNELSVDGGDNPDHYTGGFLQNFSPDSIEEFAVRTSQEDADTGGTTAGSVMITTKSGSNEWHGDAAFYERASALNAPFPIEDPAPNPKQPFSRQNMWALSAARHEEQILVFHCLRRGARRCQHRLQPSERHAIRCPGNAGIRGTDPGVTSIASRRMYPYRFAIISAPSGSTGPSRTRSQWYLRSSVDSYTTHNDLVQQGTLPSTGLLTHNNYLSLVIGNQLRFLAVITGESLFNASGLHLTQTRNSNLGFALAFPFSATSLTVSGFETFGDNQFATPITFFPSERNQEKYQFRYDLSDDPGSHALKFGVNFIHEPVLGGAFPANNETLYSSLRIRHTTSRIPAQFTADMNGGGVNLKSRRRIFAEHTAPRILRARLLAHHSRSHLELRVAILDDVRFISPLGRSQT